MVSKIHLISGLPRSGSTLLCAILRQNPRFTAAMTSPIVSLCDVLMKGMSGESEFATFFDDKRRRIMLRAMFDSYYAGVDEDNVVFDTNRSWTGRLAFLREIYPASRVICCVREVGWIIDSVERMLRANPLQLSRMFSYQAGSSVYARVELLMNSESGLIGVPWSTLREAWFGENSGSLLLIPYETLVREPAPTLRRLYKELGEPYFRHDFEHVSYDEPEFDRQMGMPGLHKVRPIVRSDNRAPSIPPDILLRYLETNFWLKPELNHRRVQIL